MNTTTRILALALHLDIMRSTEDHIELKLIKRLCEDYDEPDDIDDETLAELPDDIKEAFDTLEPSSHDDKLITVNPRKKRAGTPPNEIIDDVNNLKTYINNYCIPLITYFGSPVWEETKKVTGTLYRQLDSNAKSHFYPKPSADDAEKLRIGVTPEEPKGSDGRRTAEQNDIAREYQRIVNTWYHLLQGKFDYDHNNFIPMLKEAWLTGTIAKDLRPLVPTDDGEYLVVDDSEADDLWDESLESYAEECLEIPEAMKNYFDMDKWKADAKSDGRGHSLNRYDGSEEEVTINGDTLYIYRQN